MDKMRQEFEAWAGSYNLRRCDIDNRSYADNYVEGMWKAWRASRFELYVNLPDSEYSHDCGYVLYRSDVEAALDRAGVSFE